MKDDLKKPLKDVPEKLGDLNADQLGQQLEALDEEESAMLLRIHEKRKKLNLALRARNRKESRDNGKDLLLPIEHKNTGLPELICAESHFEQPDINFLMDNLAPTYEHCFGTVRDLTLSLCRKVGGAVPTISRVGVKSYNGGEERDRVVASWTIYRGLSTTEVASLHEAARRSYRREVCGPIRSGKYERVIRYEDYEGRTITGKKGLYFGPCVGHDSTSIGLMICRKYSSASEGDFFIKKFPLDWIGRSTGKKVVTHIELRDGNYSDYLSGLKAEDLIALIVQISFILGKKKLIDQKILMSAVYRELNRVGIKVIDKGSLYGINRVVGTVERVLLLPFHQPQMADRLQLRAESILLVGVPGVGKTSLAQYLLGGGYNVIFISLESDKLKSDLYIQIKEDKFSPNLTKIDRIRNDTGLPVVVLLDDLDTVFEGQKREELVSRFLNMMRGIREKGFYFIASTNKPEEIDKRLLEPERFSKVIHLRLPGIEERKGVLAIHTKDLPFASEAVRKEIIEAMEKRTEGWTHRYLRALCDESARIAGYSVLDGDIISKKSRQEVILSMDDFLEGHAEMLRSYNIREIVERDKEIARIVSSKSDQVEVAGFTRPLPVY